MKKILVIPGLLLGIYLNAQNVGIGTSTPQQRLEVVGKASFHDSVGIGIVNPWAPLHLNGNLSNRKLILYQIFDNDFQFDGFSTLSNATGYHVSATGLDHAFFAASSGTAMTELMRIRGNGRIGIGTATPFCRLTNSSANIIGADGIGLGLNSLGWVNPSQGYTAALYNQATLGGANGLQVKIAGASAGNILLDLSTGIGQGTTGTSVMIVRGNGHVGIGNTVPISRFANTSDNINGSDGVGINSQSVTWSTNQQGYGLGIYNQATGFGSNGLIVKIAGTTSAERILELVTGSASDNTATPVMTVFGNGNAAVAGLLSKGGGSFKIDHPLDPTNKYLYHSFVESPDMMNIYNGNITTGNDGLATITLPDYFEALNKDFRYQLTVIGDFAQAIIFKKISSNRFIIKTDKPSIEVSWQVTGIRQDAFAEKNRIPTTVEKPAAEKGRYLHEAAYN
jgi:hypothetical protein